MAKSASKGPRSNRRRRRRNGTPAWVYGLGLLLLVAIPVTVNLVRSASLPGERFASQGNLHIPLGTPHVPYNSDPPTSGPHTPQVAAWGSYDEVVPDERLVHNMEDRGVILWYELGDAEQNAANIEALEEVARGFPYTVIAPREGMPTPYALTAWTRLQRFEEIDPEGMRAFLDAYHGIDHH